jgi:hypothetical protein
VTDVGWDLRDGVTPELQVRYVHEELGIWADLGVEAIYVYQHIDPRLQSGRGLA